MDELVLSEEAFIDIIVQSICVNGIVAIDTEDGPRWGVVAEWAIPKKERIEKLRELIAREGVMNAKIPEDWIKLVAVPG